MLLLLHLNCILYSLWVYVKIVCLALSGEAQTILVRDDLEVLRLIVSSVLLLLLI